MLRALRLTALAFLFVVFAKSHALSQISSPVEIRLVPRVWEDGSYKYGIYAAMAGSDTPQLYELDTGGTGFYAVFGTNAPYITPAWGQNYSVASTNVSMAYASDNVYHGNSVSALVSIFSANTDGTAELRPKVTTTNDVLIGQTLVITNTAGLTNSGNWPSATAPVDRSFYGDFGLSLSYATNQVMNVLAQLEYGSNVIPGYAINLGSPGSTNATLQIGLYEDFETRYPIKIKMHGMDTNNPFPTAGGSNSALPTYNAAGISATMVLSNATSGAFTNAPTSVILDTGATGTLFLTNGVPGAITNYLAGNDLADGVSLSLIVETEDGSFVDLFSAITGTNGFSLNFEYRSNFTLNIGQYIFYQYEVAYNLQDGVIGLRPVPEAKQVTLMAISALAVIGFAAFRTAMPRRRRKR